MPGPARPTRGRTGPRSTSTSPKLPGTTRGSEVTSSRPRRPRPRRPGRRPASVATSAWWQGADARHGDQRGDRSQPRRRSTTAHDQGERPASDQPRPPQRDPTGEPRTTSAPAQRRPRGTAPAGRAATGAQSVTWGRHLRQRRIADAVDLEQLVDRGEPAVVAPPGMIAAAVTGPTPGSDSRATGSAVLRLTSAAGRCSRGGAERRRRPPAGTGAPRPGSARRRRAAAPG